jgi:hypothetical protein
LIELLIHFRLLGWLKNPCRLQSYPTRSALCNQTFDALKLSIINNVHVWPRVMSLF